MSEGISVGWEGGQGQTRAGEGIHVLSLFGTGQETLPLLRTRTRHDSIFWKISFRLITPYVQVPDSFWTFRKLVHIGTFNSLILAYSVQCTLANENTPLLKQHACKARKMH